MKILYVHQNFGDQGGAELYVRDTANALAMRGHQCGLLFREQTSKNEGLWESVFPSRWRALGAEEAQTTQRAIEGFDPDVICVNNESNVKILRAVQQSERPVIKVVHDHNLYCLRGYRYNYFTRKICERPVGPHCLTRCLACVTRQGFGLSRYTEKKQELEIARGFEHLVAVSRHIQSQLILNGCLPERVLVIHPVPRVAKLPHLPQFNDRNLILCASQILRGKGIDFLLRAVALLEEPYECVILGDGSYRRKCERLAAKLGLGQRVFFKGYVPHEQVAEYSSQASVVAVPSVWAEPCALVGVEAISLGLPVVAFDVGGNSDWVRDGVNGYLVPPMDCRAYAAKLQALLRNKELCAQMGRRGQEIAAVEFDFQKQLTKLESVFTQLSKPLSAALSTHANPSHTISKAAC